MSNRKTTRDRILSRLETYYEDERIRTHCEEALSIADRALELTSRRDEPQIWAKLHLMLGRFAVIWGYQQNDLPLIRRGIKASRNAQSFWTRKSRAEIWTAAQMNVADGWLARGELEEDAAMLHTAIAEFNLAAEETSHEGDPSKWATVMSAIGNCSYRLGVVSGDPRFLDQAMDHYESTLDVWQRDRCPEDWSNQTFNIGLCLAFRASLEGSPDLHQSAIEKMTASTSAISRNTRPIDWGSRKNSIANARAAIGALTGTPEHFQAALRDYEEALEVFPRDEEPAWWAMLTQNVIVSLDGLGHLLQDPDLHREAIERAADAKLTATKEQMPNYWAGITAIAAHSRICLARLLGDVRPLGVAIEELTGVAECRSREGVPLQWAYNMHYRGSVHFELGRSEHDPKELEAAIGDFDQALTVLTKDNAPSLWIYTATERADARSALGSLRRDVTILGSAVSEFDEILDVLAGENEPMAVARARLGRGEAILLAANESEAQDRLSTAEDDFLSVANNISAAVDPERFLRARRGICSVHLLRGDLESAARTAETLLKEAERLLSAAPADHARANLTKALTGVGELGAYAFASLGLPERALAVLELGRAFQLRSRLSEAEADLPPEDASRIEEMRLALTRARRAYQAALESEDGDVAARRLLEHVVGLHKEFSELLDDCDLDPVARPPGLTEIQKAVSAGRADALVAFMATVRGGAAIVVTGQGEPDVLSLPALTTQSVEAALWTPNKTGWLDHYDRFRTALVRTGGCGDAASLDAWNNAINETRKSLWAMCMRDLSNHLRTLRLSTDSTIVSVPNGHMSALPIHAAGDHDKCLLDDWAVCTAPSITAFVASHERAVEPDRTANNLLAATDPNGDLATPRNPASDHFPVAQRRDLAGAEASREAVMTALPQCSYASFFTHAWWEPDRPERSWIQLAGDDRIEARDFADLDLNKCRMIVLGACESGMPGLKQSPDEFEGLPTSLLQAGVPGVLATLWPVFNHSSAALIDRFFEAHVKNGCSPAQALRRAQCALRDGMIDREPREERPRAAFWVEEDEPGRFRAQGIRPAGKAPAVERHSFDPSRPIFWAAFVYLGA